MKKREPGLHPDRGENPKPAAGNAEETKCQKNRSAGIAPALMSQNDETEKERTVNELFEMNGTIYRTDAGTLAVLRSIVQSAKETGDASAVAAVMSLGMATGRIIEN